MLSPGINVTEFWAEHAVNIAIIDYLMQRELCECCFALLDCNRYRSCINRYSDLDRTGC